MKAMVHQCSVMIGTTVKAFIFAGDQDEEALLEAGADGHAKDEDGRTAFMIADEGGHNEIVDLLKKSGAKE